MKIKKVLQSESNRLIIFISLLILLLGSTTSTRFLSIKLLENPAIFFGESGGDTVSNRTPGIIEFGSTIKAKSFIGDTSEIPANTYYVSPSFTNNTYRKLSTTIQGAINALDSGTIYVMPGVYNEKITLKSRISIIGSGVDRTTITYTNDSCAIYGEGITNLLIQNINISVTQASKDTVSAIKLRSNYKDSTNFSAIVFDNVRITAAYKVGTGVCIYGIIADSTSITVQNSYIKVIANVSSSGARACLRLSRGSVVTFFNNFLICTSGLLLPDDGVIYSVDTRCKLTMDLSRFYTGTFNNGYNLTGRYYNNIGNEDYSNIVNLIDSPNNIYDTDFYIK